MQGLAGKGNTTDEALAAQLESGGRGESVWDGGVFNTFKQNVCGFRRAPPRALLLNDDWVVP